MARLSDELRNRCKKFSSGIIQLFVGLPRQRDEVNIIGKQLLRSGTSVAAHVREASRARSDAEFCSKLDGMLQEADECQLWLEHLKEDCGMTSAEIPRLHKEADELISIFTIIVSKTRRNGSERAAA